ncbi:MAG: cytochrome c biogenesis protein CcsA [Muribaculaceae bacterium]
MLKFVIYTIYVVLLLSMAAATIVEKCYGSASAHDSVYEAHWFVALWAALVAWGIAYLLRRKMTARFAVMGLHLSFVVILAGAFVSYVSAERGMVHLRIGERQTQFVTDDGLKGELPFSMELVDFSTLYYPGTKAPLDYMSEIRFDGNDIYSVSMNNIAYIQGYRFYQSSYDDDGEGVTFGFSHDPLGIAVSYMGYALLLISCIALLFSKFTAIHRLYGRALKPIVVTALLSMAIGASAQSVQVVSNEVAHDFGRVNVLWNNRICPVESVATDFVVKLAGKSSWHGYSAVEVFCSWMIYYTSWEQQRLICVKNRRVQRLIGIDDQWACYDDFWDTNNEYKLAAALDSARNNKVDTQYKKALLETDEKVNVVLMFYNGAMLKMFPVAEGDGKVEWHAPGTVDLPMDMPSREFYFVKHVGDYLVEAMLSENQPRARSLSENIRAYQREKLGDVLPSRTVTEVECVLCMVQSARWIAFLVLFCALVMCIIDTVGGSVGSSKVFRRVSWSISTFYALYLTLMIGARWYVARHIPLSNGYETMLFMSWAILIFSLAMAWRFSYARSMGILASALCYLVAMIAGSNPQITPLMPVLQSPMMSLHVLAVMSAYALFTIQLFISMRVLVLLRMSEYAEAEKSTCLSRFLLYPAQVMLMVGIFVGAVWANVSWGNYWSWDPKETWALITLMIYAIPLHAESLPWVSSVRAYNIFMIVAFTTVLITYFGVNYILTGMHSYAG